MIIDFHTHVFPEKIANQTINALASSSGATPHTDGTVSGMLGALDRASADIAVALPVLTKPAQFDSVARFAKELNLKFSVENNRIISFAGMHPKCENIDEKMKYLKDNGFLGVKIHPDYQDTFIDDEGYFEILRCAKKYDLIVVTHAGVDDAYLDKPIKCPPDRLIKLIDSVEHKKFVLAHYGGHKLWREVYDLIAGKDLYLDTAFTLHEISKDLFVKILDKHGADKVLFATDCPWRDIKDDVEILKSYRLSREIEDMILYKNALELLNIRGEK